MTFEEEKRQGGRIGRRREERSNDKIECLERERERIRMSIWEEKREEEERNEVKEWIVSQEKMGNK